MRDPEYDRFGPWILEISETDPLPPLFAPYFVEEEASLLRVKIPRQAERRDLRPGMDMYDYVVSMYESEMNIHVRDGKSVAKFAIAYQDIVAVRNTEDLLNGHLRIYSREYDYDIPYSTVSVDLILRIVGIIRGRYMNADADAAESPRALDRLKNAEANELGFYFTGYLRTLAEEHPEFRIVAAQAETRVASVEHRFWRRLFYGAVDKRLLECLHLSDGKELQIVGRGRTWAYRWHAVYGKETLYLPLERIVSVELSEDPSNSAMKRLLIMTGISKHSFVLGKDNPDAEGYFEWLEGATRAANPIFRFRTSGFEQGNS